MQCLPVVYYSNDDRDGILQESHKDWRKGLCRRRLGAGQAYGTLLPRQRLCGLWA